MNAAGAADLVQVEAALDELIRRLSSLKRSTEVRDALIEARRLRGIVARWIAIPPPVDARREFMTRFHALLHAVPEQTAAALPLPPEEPAPRSAPRWVVGEQTSSSRPVSIHDEETPQSTSHPWSKGEFPIHDEETKPEGRAVRRGKKAKSEEKTVPAGVRFPSIHDEETAPAHGAAIAARQGATVIADEETAQNPAATATALEHVSALESGADGAAMDVPMFDADTVDIPRSRRSLGLGATAKTLRSKRRKQDAKSPAPGVAAVDEPQALAIEVIEAPAAAPSPIDPPAPPAVTAPAPAALARNAEPAERAMASRPSLHDLDLAELDRQVEDELPLTELPQTELPPTEAAPSAVAPTQAAPVVGPAAADGIEGLSKKISSPSVPAVRATPFAGFKALSRITQMLPATRGSATAEAPSPSRKSSSDPPRSPLTTRSNTPVPVVRRAATTTWSQVRDAAGVTFRLLVDGKGAGLVTALITLAPGASIGARPHEKAGELVVLRGEVQCGAELLRTGDAVTLAPAILRPQLTSPAGCTLLYCGDCKDEGLEAP